MLQLINARTTPPLALLTFVFLCPFGAFFYQFYPPKQHTDLDKGVCGSAPNFY